MPTGFDVGTSAYNNQLLDPLKPKKLDPLAPKKEIEKELKLPKELKAPKPSEETKGSVFGQLTLGKVDLNKLHAKGNASVVNGIDKNAMQKISTIDQDGGQSHVDDFYEAAGLTKRQAKKALKKGAIVGVDKDGDGQADTFGINSDNKAGKKINKKLAKAQDEFNNKKELNGVIDQAYGEGGEIVYSDANLKRKDGEKEFTDDIKKGESTTLSKEDAKTLNNLGVLKKDDSEGSAGFDIDKEKINGLTDKDLEGLSDEQKAMVEKTKNVANGLKEDGSNGDTLQDLQKQQAELKAPYEAKMKAIKEDDSLSWNEKRKAKRAIKKEFKAEQGDKMKELKAEERKEQAKVNTIKNKYNLTDKDGKPLSDQKISEMQRDGLIKDGKIDTEKAKEAGIAGEMRTDYLMNHPEELKNASPEKQAEVQMMQMMQRMQQMMQAMNGGGQAGGYGQNYAQGSNQSIAQGGMMLGAALSGMFNKGNNDGRSGFLNLSKTNASDKLLDNSDDVVKKGEEELLSSNASGDLADNQA